MDEESIRLKLPPETIEQIKLFDWIRSRPDLEPFTIHIANERQCSVQHGRILKRMGVKAGVADIFLAVPIGNYHGLWLELKAGNNKATEKQKLFLANMTQKGYMSACVTGYEAAREVIETYLTMDTLSS